MMYSYFDCRNFSQSRYCREKCISFCRFWRIQALVARLQAIDSRYLCWSPLVRSQMFSLLRVHSLSKWDQCGAAERVTCGGICELRICWLSDCFLVCMVARMPVCQLVFFSFHSHSTIKLANWPIGGISQGSPQVPKCRWILLMLIFTNR
jgi:hypothetical protein